VASSYSLKKIIISVKWMIRTIYEITSGRITFRYGLIKIWSQLTFVGKRFVDGVNWNSYNLHYLEELKITEKNYTLLIKRNDFIIESGKIKFKSERIKPLQFSHELLYETIIKLNPSEVLEIGCGAGDHLANLSTLNPKIDCKGIDLLAKQIDLLNLRHPNNNFTLKVGDVTAIDFLLPETELIFTHAVLMHISEKNQRYQNALSNIFNSAQKYVILMENWTQHDFFEDIKNYLQDYPEWKIYFEKSTKNQKTRIMIISKLKLSGFEPLLNYEELTFGEKVIYH